MPTRANKLTPKQEKFVQEYILNGGNKTQAYIAAYDTKDMLKETIMSAACRLFNDYKVSARYKELLEASKQSFITTATEKRKLYRDTMYNEDLPVNERLKASDLDNKIAGEYSDTTDINLNFKPDGKLIFKYK